MINYQFWVLSHYLLAVPGQETEYHRNTETQSSENEVCIFTINIIPLRENSDLDYFCVLKK